MKLQTIFYDPATARPGGVIKNDMSTCYSHDVHRRRTQPLLRSSAVFQVCTIAKRKHFRLLYLYLLLSLNLRLCCMFCAIYLQMQLQQQHKEEKQRRLIKPTNQNSKSVDGKKFLLCNGIELFE